MSRILFAATLAMIFSFQTLAAEVFPMPNTLDQYGRPLTKASLYYKDKKHLIAVSSSREGMERMKEVVGILQKADIKDKANIFIFSNMSAAPRFIEGPVKGSFQWNGAPQAWLDWDAKTKDIAVPAKTNQVWVYIIDNAGNVLSKIDATTSLNTEDIKASLK